MRLEVKGGGMNCKDYASGTLENGTPPREVEEGGWEQGLMEKLWTRLRTISNIPCAMHKRTRESF